MGLSPAMGFIHIGNQLSFVYDIADIYKVDFILPIVFKTVAENPPELEREVRLRCRDFFKEQKFMSRIVDDIWTVLQKPQKGDEFHDILDMENGTPAELWDPAERKSSGINYAEEL